MVLFFTIARFLGGLWRVSATRLQVLFDVGALRRAVADIGDLRQRSQLGLDPLPPCYPMTFGWALILCPLRWTV